MIYGSQILLDWIRVFGCCVVRCDELAGMQYAEADYRQLELDHSEFKHKTKPQHQLDTTHQCIELKPSSYDDDVQPDCSADFITLTPLRDIHTTDVLRPYTDSSA